MPGSYWKQLTPSTLAGLRYNIGPFGEANWWSSDAPNGQRIYSIHAIIDTWSPDKAINYARKGYVHYHMLQRVDNGQFHPTLVVWFRSRAHFACLYENLWSMCDPNGQSFILDGGPTDLPFNLPHLVTPGIDFQFLPNWLYPPL